MPCTSDKTDEVRFLVNKRHAICLGCRFGEWTPAVELEIGEDDSSPVWHSNTQAAAARSCRALSKRNGPRAYYKAASNPVSRRCLTHDGVVS